MVDLGNCSAALGNSLQPLSHSKSDALLQQAAEGGDLQMPEPIAPLASGEAVKIRRETMSKTKDLSQRHGKGRPRIEDLELILTHFRDGIAKGQTVTAIANKGITILEHKILHGDGKHQLRVARQLNPATLQRRYREACKIINGAVERVRSSPVTVNATYIGVSAPRTPLSFPDMRL